LADLLGSNLINTRNNRVLLDHLINITNRENEYAKTVSPHRTSVQQSSHNKRNYFRKLEQDRIAHENEIIARKLMKQYKRIIIFNVLGKQGQVLGSRFKSTSENIGIT